MIIHIFSMPDLDLTMKTTEMENSLSSLLSYELINVGLKV